MEDVRVPRTSKEVFDRTINDFTSRFISKSIFSTKIPVLELSDEPELGDVRIDWFSELVQAEGSGELVAVEQWDGESWRQYGLDAHSTVQDLLDLEWQLASLCTICGKDMTANCNNANCDF